jgi:hypothetical protein
LKEVAFPQRKFGWKMPESFENWWDLVPASFRSRIGILDGFDGDHRLVRKVVYASMV